MSNWLWPQKVHSMPTAGQRLGRVLHWFLTAASMIGALVIFVGTATMQMRDLLANAFFLLCMGATFLTGRALRYILSGE